MRKILKRARKKTKNLRNVKQSQKKSLFHLRRPKNLKRLRKNPPQKRKRSLKMIKNPKKERPNPKRK